MTDTDGSETLSATISTIPTDAKIFDDLGDELTISNNAVTITDPLRLAALDQFSIQPPPDDDTDFTLTVTSTSTEGANNDQASIQQTFDVTVIAVADTPNLATATISGSEDTAIDFTGLSSSLTDTDGSETLSVTISTIPTDAKIFDDLGDELTISNNAVTITDPLRLAALDQFSIKPPPDDDADFTLTVTSTSTDGANNDQASIQQTFNVTVNAVADTPSLAVSVAPLVTNENTEVDLTGLSSSLIDTDGSETLSVTISTIPTDAKIFDDLGVELTVSNNAVTITDPLRLAALDQFSIQPPPDDDTDFTLTVTSTSTEGANNDQASIQQTFDVTVIAVADTPNLATAAISGSEDTAIDFTGLSSSLTDTDGSETLSVTISTIPTDAKIFDDLGIELTVSNNAVTITDPLRLAALDQFSIKPPPDDDANFTLTVTSTSTEGANNDQASIQQTFNVTVNAVADAPSLAVPVVALVTSEDTPIDFTGLSSSLTDTDGSETLSVTISTIPTDAKIFDDLGIELTVSNNAVTITDPLRLAALDQFSIKPPPDDDTDFTLTVTSTSTEGANNDQASVQQTFNVTVNAVADTPNLATAAISGSEDTAIDFTGLSSSLTDTDSSEALSVTISGLPAGATLFDNLGNPVDLAGGSAGLVSFSTTVSASFGPNAGFFSAGDAVEISYEFDTAVVDSNLGDPNTGSYLGATLNLTFAFPDLSFNVDFSQGDVSVFDDTSNPDDQIFIFANVDQGSSLLNGETINATELDFTGLTSMLPSDALPQTLPEDVTGVVAFFQTSSGFTEVHFSVGNIVALSQSATITDTARIAALDQFTVVGAPDSDDDFTVTVTATTTEGANADQASVQQTLDVTVDAVADTPTLAVQNVATPLDTEIHFTGLSSSLTDTDGSETLSVTIGSIPNGAKIFDDLDFELTISNNEVTITDPARLAALDQFSILPPAGDSTDITLQITATASESEDSANAIQTFTVTVGEPPPAVWQNTSQDDSWHTDLNWSTILVPQDGEDATLADATGVVNYTTGTTALVNLTASEDLSVDGGTLTVSGTGTFDGTSTLTLNGGSFGGTGAITVADQFQYISGTLTGSGGAITVNGTTTITAGAKTIDKDLTLVGTTTATNALIAGFGVLTNQGSWTLTDSSIAASNALANQGSLTAEGSNVVAGTYTNELGSTLIVEAGLVGDAGLTIGTGFINAGAIILDDLTIHNATLTVSTGTLINAGTIKTQDTDTGGGGTGTRSIQAELDNQGTVTIDTAADINKADAAHLNSGLIDINDDLLVQQTGTTPTFTSTGTIDLAADKTLTINGGTFTNDTDGTIQGSGTLDVSSSTFVGNGTLSPGTSAGTLTVIGSFEQSKTGVIEIELEGNVAGAEYDVLKVVDNLTLGGTLDVSLIGGFTPIAPNTFQIIDATSIDAAVLGDFATINGLDIGGGLVLDAAFSLTAVTLTATNVTLAGAALADVLTSDGSADVIEGGAGDDTLIGGGGADIIYGQTGADSISVDDSAFLRVDGGAGIDELAILNDLDLTTLRGDQIERIEVFNINGDDAVTLSLDAQSVINAVDGTNALTGATKSIMVLGGSDDTVDFSGNWTWAGSQIVNGIAANKFEDGDATVFVEVGVNISGAPTPGEINLAGLDGSDGFVLDGAVDGDATGNSVAGIGDINGDGFEDYVIGAYRADPNVENQAGEAIILFGSASGPTGIDLATISASEGFRINGETTSDAAGYSVSGAGDINGDGFADVIVSAPFSGYGSVDAGEAYVIFGGAGVGASGAIEVSSLDGTNGFRLTGIDSYDKIGQSVASAGDINGDGFDDLIVGAPNADPFVGQGPVNNGGESYVLFGAAGTFSPVVGFDDFTGFTINGDQPDGYSGLAVSDIGDVNGDGIGDLAIGVPYGGTSSDNGLTFVVFGTTGGFATQIQLSDLAYSGGQVGINIVGSTIGERTGYALSGAGDVNGDGFEDFLIGSSPSSGAGTAYVVFGSAGFGLSGTIVLSDLSGSNGFKIDGVSVGDQAGAFVGEAGDINGDGFDDIIVGADGVGNGTAYVIFGGTSIANTGLFELSSFDGSNGLTLPGLNFEDAVGPVDGAGDINGDGFDDLIVGAPGADPQTRAEAGGAYIVYGSDFTGAVTQQGASGADLLSGTIGSDVMIGGLGDDTLEGSGGSDVMRGGGGDDLLLISDATFQQIDGGTNSAVGDTLKLEGAITTLDLTSIANNRIQNVEIADITGSGNSTLVLQVDDVLDFSETTDTLKILGDAGDAVSTAGESWEAQGNVVVDNVTYQKFTFGVGTLLIDTDVDTTGIV